MSFEWNINMKNWSTSLTTVLNCNCFFSFLYLCSNSGHICTLSEKQVSPAFSKGLKTFKNWERYSSTKIYLRLQNLHHLMLQSTILINSFHRRGPKSQETGTPPPHGPHFSLHPIPALPYSGTGKNNLKGRLPNRPSTFHGGRISTEAFWWHGAPGKQNQGGEGVLLKSLVCNSFQRRIHWHLDLKTCKDYIVSERLFYKAAAIK